MANEGTSVTGWAANADDAPRIAGVSVIGPSPLKILGSTAALTVLATAVVAVLIPFVGFLATPWPLSHAVGILVSTAALFAAFAGFAAIGALLWDRPRVEIEPDGFVIQGMAGRRPRRWGDIDGEFAVVRSGWRRVVAYRLTEAAKGSAGPQMIGPLAYFDEAILVCGELAVGARELANILNQAKRGGSGEPIAADHSRIPT